MILNNPFVILNGISHFFYFTFTELYLNTSDILFNLSDMSKNMNILL